jgi:hypothetical protein
LCFRMRPVRDFRFLLGVCIYDFDDGFDLRGCLCVLFALRYLGFGACMVAWIGAYSALKVAMLHHVDVAI